MLKEEEVIAKYPKIFEPYEGNPDGVNWEIPKGWCTVVDWMCGVIQDYIDHNQIHTREGVVRPQQVKCFQIKEKFGGLRFYTDDHDEKVDGMIRFAEYLCDRTCVKCGSMEDVKLTQGWIMPVCHKCFKEELEPKGIKLMEPKSSL